MYFAVFIYIFFECIFLTRSTLTYTIYESALNPRNIKMKIDGTIELPTRNSESVEHPAFSSTENDSYEHLNSMPKISRVGVTSVKDTGKTDEKVSNEKKLLKFWKWNNPGIKLSHEVSTSEKVDKETRESVNDSIAMLSRVMIASVKGTDDTLDKDTSRENNSNEDEDDTTEKLSRVIPASSKAAGKTLYNELSSEKQSKAKKRAKHSRVVSSSVKETGKALDKVFLRGNNSHEDFNDSMVKTDKALGKNKTRKSKLLRTRRPEPGGLTQLSLDTHHKVQDDKRIRKFTDHVYQQTLKAFENMKQKSDSYTKLQIDTLVKSYKEKFTDFVTRTRQIDIKTREGTRNVLIHIIDTSNLMMGRIVNFLKANNVATDELGPGGLKGWALRLDQEMDAVKQLEYEHACKKFGVCRNSDGIRTVLLDLISILLKLPDAKLVQFNDAATEQLKNMDFSKIGISDETIQMIKKKIRNEERTTAKELRFRLIILYGSLSKSHLPFIVNKAVYFEKPAVQRTVTFHSFIDALEEALPPTEANKREWAVAKDRLKRWADGHPLDIQEILQAFFDNIIKGVAKSKKIKKLITGALKPE